MDIDTQLAYILRQVIIVINEKLKRINSLITDTYTIIRSLWNKIQTSSQLRYMFYIPYNSHDI